ncbi:MAG: CmcI family methyltransferase [Deltaproteobacteria bacterium]|jgi:cephalosporin hydroxylase
MNNRLRFFLNRVINVLRPAPRYLPLTVEQVLANQNSLDLVEGFNDLYYSSGMARNLNWRGMEMIKNPCDLWNIVELMQRLRPVVILETGTHHGASAIFYAEMAKLFDIACTVITIDINPKWSIAPESKNIVSLVGYSVDPEIVEKAEAIIRGKTEKNPGHVMVMLDSDHSEANVSQELELFHPLVTVDSYLIVEDTNINGHPVAPEHGPGPWEAVDKFLAGHAEFVPDRDCERFLLTFNPRGWLKRIK